MRIYLARDAAVPTEGSVYKNFIDVNFPLVIVSVSLPSEVLIVPLNSPSTFPGFSKPDELTYSVIFIVPVPLLAATVLNV